MEQNITYVDDLEYECTLTELQDALANGFTVTSHIEKLGKCEVTAIDGTIDEVHVYVTPTNRYNMRLTITNPYRQRCVFKMYAHINTNTNKRQ